VTRITQRIALGNRKKLPGLRSSAGMMCAFSIGDIDGKGEAAFNCGVVDRGCEGSTAFCQRETFRKGGSKEAASFAWRSRAKSHETGNPVPVDQTERSGRQEDEAAVDEVEFRAAFVPWIYMREAKVILLRGGINEGE
jgi:hypothetical protein